MTEVFLVFENEFFEGDLIATRCCGVFSSEENANEQISFIQDDTIYDPLVRVKYSVKPAVIDEPIFEEE